MDEPLYVEGELFISLEVVAEIYQAQVVLLRGAFESGMLGPGVDQGSTVCIAAVHLDRVATIVRLHETLGLDLERIEQALLDDELD